MESDSNPLKDDRVQCVMRGLAAGIGEQAIEDYRSLREDHIILDNGVINDSVSWQTTIRDNRRNISRPFNRRYHGMTRHDVDALLYVINSPYFEKILEAGGIIVEPKEIRKIIHGKTAFTTDPQVPAKR